MSQLDKMLKIVLAQQAIELNKQVMIGDTARGQIAMDDNDDGRRYEITINVLREGVDGQRLRVTMDLREVEKISLGKAA
jgi:hypothetical protein